MGGAIGVCDRLLIDNGVEIGVCTAGFERFTMLKGPDIGVLAGGAGGSGDDGVELGLFSLSSREREGVLASKDARGRFGSRESVELSRDSKSLG